MNTLAGPTARRGSTASGRKALPNKQFRPDIEGLRAVAVLAVVLFHAGVPGFGGGFIGVDVFFVVSGFLITGLLWREASGTGTVRMAQFYAGRARRLLPAAALVLVATSMAATLLLPPLQARSVLADAIASALYVGNYRFAAEGTDYLAAETAASPLQHYWSLGVEEQFYLLWPALILATAWVLTRCGRGTRSAAPYACVLAVVAGASLAVSLAWTETMPPWAFFSLPTRAWELAAGGLIALTAAHWRNLPPVCAALVGWGGLVLILVTCTQLGTTTPYPGSAALLPVMGTALVIGAGCAIPGLGVGRLLSKPALRGIGRLSYSWYLWHWPVLLLAPALFGHGLGLAGRLAMMVMSLGLAILTLHLVENPARFATALRGSSWRSLAVGATATGVAVCAGLVLLAVRPVPTGSGPAAVPVAVVGPSRAAVPTQTPEQRVQAAVAASADLRAVPSNLSPPLGNITKPEAFVNGCVLSWQDVAVPDCVSGDTASATRVALVGDSHAGMWHPALEAAAQQQRWRLETFAKVTCPPMKLPILSPYLGREFTECKQWRADVLTRIAKERPALIVLDMVRRYGADFGFVSYDPAWLDGLTRLVSQLRGTGARVLVLGPVPDPHTTVPTCLSAHMDDATACTPDRSIAVNDTGIAAEAAAVQAGGGQYARLDQYFCTGSRCPVIVGNTLVFRDDNHITAEYAQLLSPVIARLTESALAPN
ncbi:acyltransferase family protein [Mycolicibacterium neworleansense]|uniref:Acyltransferase n=1 Tax=Mycolicibacterium neworleansense TaxID=146018 RepID=A0A0H5RU56_9MYCO|nr:acyltransferase family protein [Mycolicibacterium neworleansense]MCV7363180.1 acyltransferase [Mycolicibacterium neworleansense]CRZ17077.1 acyltransferase [Mycolicibacterium neworleansense]